MTRLLYVADAGSIHTRRWLEHYRDRGFEVHVASFNVVPVEGVQVHALPRPKRGKLGYLLAVPALRALARRLRPDLVHAHYLTSFGALAALAGLRPLIATAWGSDVLLNPQASWALNRLTRFVLWRANAVTAVAQHMLPPLQRLAPAGKPLLCIPFGVDTQRFTPSAAARDDDPSRPLRLVSTRNLEPIYDLPTLLRALGICRQRGLKLVVDIVGDGSQRAALEAQANELGLAADITFHGRVAHTALPAILARSDLFVTSALSDGNNVSLNEAMACGSFPIGTDIPANSQWLRQRDNGLLFPAGDAEALARCLIDAAADPAWRRAAAATNRAEAEQRASWQHFAQRMDALYDEVIAAART